MRFLKNWLLKFLLSKSVKSWLDKLPLNGKKTWLSFLVLVIGILLQYLSPDSDFSAALKVIHELLSSTTGLVIITDPNAIQVIAGTFASIFGAFGAVVGAYHKLIKRIWDKSEVKKDASSAS